MPLVDVIESGGEGVWCGGGVGGREYVYQEK